MYSSLQLLTWLLTFYFFHCSFVDMLNIISTCRDILCVDINVDKRCVDHSTSHYILYFNTTLYILYICDVIKQNESELANTVFKIQQNKADSFFCFLLFVQSLNCLYLSNQLLNLCGVFTKLKPKQLYPNRKCQKTKKHIFWHQTHFAWSHIFWLQTHFAWSHHICISSVIFTQ